MKKWTSLIALMMALCMVFTGCMSTVDMVDRDDDDEDEREEENAEPEILFHTETVDMLTEEYYYDGDGSLITSYRYEYDAFGNLAVKQVVNAEGTVTSKSVHEYDENGHLIRTENYYSDGNLGSTETYTYNEEGQCVLLVYEYIDGSMVFTTEYAYDAAGNLISAVETDEEGNFRSAQEYTYNEDHTERYTVKYDADRNGSRRENGGEYDLYDANGNLIYWCTYGSGDNMASKDDPAYQGECFYDENGLLVEETFSELGGYIVSKDLLTYDTSGNLVYQERIHISSGRELNHYEYVYQTMDIMVLGDE